MIGETVTIILPLPPRVLSPNCPPGSRGGRMAKAAASKKYRKLACDAAKAEQVESGPWEKATARAAFFHKQRRRRDDVNHLAMLKAAYDGVVQAGLLADDDSEHLKTLTPTFAIDRKFDRVELTFTREGEERI